MDIKLIDVLGLYSRCKLSYISQRQDGLLAYNTNHLNYFYLRNYINDYNDNTPIKYSDNSYNISISFENRYTPDKYCTIFTIPEYIRPPENILTGIYDDRILYHTREIKPYLSKLNQIPYHLKKSILFKDGYSLTGIVYLLKNHYDIFGLIDNNKALVTTSENLYRYTKKINFLDILPFLNGYSININELRRNGIIIKIKEVIIKWFVPYFDKKCNNSYLLGLSYINIETEEKNSYCIQLLDNPKNSNFEDDGVYDDNIYICGNKLKIMVNSGKVKPIFTSTEFLAYLNNSDDVFGLKEKGLAITL